MPVAGGHNQPWRGYYRLRGESARRLRMWRECEYIPLKRATHLRAVAPHTTEEAQFSVPWPVACALIDGVVGPEQVSEQGRTDPARRELAARVEVVVDAKLDKAFPDQALAWVEIETTEGGCARSGISAAQGDPGTLFRDRELVDKFSTLADPVLGSDCAKKLVSAIHTLPDSSSLNEIIDLLRLTPSTNARETQLEPDGGSMRSNDLCRSSSWV